MFIKLTNAYNAIAVYINIDHILTFRHLPENPIQGYKLAAKTSIEFMSYSADMDNIYVAEDVDSVIALIPATHRHLC